MRKNKYISLVLSMCMTMGCLGLTGCSNKSDTTSNNTANSQNSEYSQVYFDRDKVMEIDIKIDEAELSNMFENATDEEYKTASITVNGDDYENIAVRTKGNSSLKAVASDSESDRYSFKIKFDKYEKDQSMAGLTKLNLNNCYSDPTYMREFIAYSIFEEMGLKTPEFAYAKVSINGEYHGLYLAVEDIDESFIENNFENADGDLYKSTGQNGGSLVYKDDNIESYSNLELKSDGEGDSKQLIDMISALNSGENIENYLDVDSALKYIAINTAILNLDSYLGTFAHNYYLYEYEDGKFTIIPWDYNMAFGGFMQGNNNSDVLIDIDNPTMTNLDQRPLVKTLLANEEYKEKYYKYLEEIVNTYLDSDYLENMTSKLHDLIATYVKEDPSSFYTFEEFETNIKTSIESTEQMGGGMQRPEGMENMQPPEAMEMPNIEDMKDMQPPEGMENMQPPEGMEMPNAEDMKNMQPPEGMENGNKGTKTLPGILELGKQLSETIKKQLNS